MSQGHYYQAHDVWEAAWQPLPIGSSKCLVQALIQWTVGLHHDSKGNTNGARRLFAKSMAVLDSFESLGWPPVRLGCQLPALTGLMRQQVATLQWGQPLEPLSPSQVALLFQPIAKPIKDITTGLD